MAGDIGATLIRIFVDGASSSIAYFEINGAQTWEGQRDTVYGTVSNGVMNTTVYSISDNNVTWLSNNKQLFYSGTAVLASDEIIEDGQYTTASSIPAVSFKHHYKNSTLIGSGAVKFRRFSAAEPEPMLSAPSNVTVAETTVSWDPVENATSYDVMVDGAVYESIEQQTSTPTLINFSIGSTSYQAEEGMTWEQWVNSEYNTDGYIVYNTCIANEKYHTPAAGGRVTTDSSFNSSVAPTDVISPTTYYFGQIN